VDSDLLGGGREGLRRAWAAHEVSTKARQLGTAQGPPDREQTLNIGEHCDRE
jgi:hypothetical protein